MRTHAQFFLRNSQLALMLTVSDSPSEALSVHVFKSCFYYDRPYDRMPGQALGQWPMSSVAAVLAYGPTSGRTCFLFY